MENKRMKELLAEFEVSKDLPALLLHCAEWTVDELNSFNFKPLPLKPREVIEYEEMPERDREELSKEFFTAHPQILYYSNLVRFVKQENKAIYDWLVDCRTRLLLNGQPEGARIIDEKLKGITVEQLWQTEKEVK